MRTAIIGLPQVGKTSLFTILTGMARETRLGGTAVQVGVAHVPDSRVDRLADVFQPPKITARHHRIRRHAGAVEEALRDPGIMSSLRVGDAFLHVVRLSDDDTVMHVEGSLDPERDWKNVEIELILSDLVVVEKRLERVEKTCSASRTPSYPKNATFC